jgi:hypothetical protein
MAQMAELVDALGSGPSGGNTVEVRVLFWAPGYILQDPRSRAYSLSISVLCLSVNYYGTKSTPFATCSVIFPSGNSLWRISGNRAKGGTSK